MSVGLLHLSSTLWKQYSVHVALYYLHMYCTAGVSSIYGSRGGGGGGGNPIRVMSELHEHVNMCIWKDMWG